MITSTKGLKIWMEIDESKPTEITPTVVTETKPVTVTVSAGDMAKIVDGEAITFSGTTYPELDGKLYVISNLTATTFDLLGSDMRTTSGVALDKVNAKAMAYSVTDLETLCLSSIDISAGSSNTIDISTFCTPGASLPGNPTAGTMTFNGFTDIASKGYAQLLQAEADGKARVLKIDVPNNGYLIGRVTVGSVAWGVPLEGSTTYSFAATMSTPMIHVF